MTSKTGFGKPQTLPKATARTAKRAEAARQFDKMKASGDPEFEIYIRIQGKKNWYPVGAIAVKRSSQINHAIFDSREQLVQGAFRLYPVLRKHQNQLDYGYRLKEFKDEPIQLAEPPVTRINGVQAAIAQVQNRVSSWLKRK